MPAIQDEKATQKAINDRRNRFINITELKQKLIILSKGWQVDMQFIKAKKQMVMFHREQPASVDDRPVTRFYYWAKVITLDKEGKVATENEGIVELPVSVMMDIWQNEKDLEIDKVDYEWIVGKKKEGDRTTYTAVRGKNATRLSEEEMEANYSKVELSLPGYEADLEQKYNAVIAESTFNAVAGSPEKKPKQRVRQEDAVPEADDIPF